MILNLIIIGPGKNQKIINVGPKFISESRVFNILKGLNVVPIPFMSKKCGTLRIIFKKKEGHILKYATWRVHRYRPRFFEQVGHQTTSAYIENKHFFTKSCHRQTYQNYKQSQKNWAHF